MEAATLPPVYARWIDEILGAPIPAEVEATCSSCAMIPREGEPVGPTTFRPDTRCCTYMPAIPSFLVGGLLSDPAPALEHGRDTVRARIGAGAGATPGGLAPPPAYRVLFEQTAAGNPRVFGRTKALRCPHFVEETSGCSVWAWRESTCATWFCKFSRGGVGQAFWTALRNLLREVEASLSLWCAAELVSEVGVLDRVLDQPSRRSFDGEEIDGHAPIDAAGSWGAWAGREEAFYVAAWRLVEPLSWAEVRAIGGANVAVRERMLRSAWERLQDRGLPDALRPGALGAVEIGPQWARITTYRSYDPLEVPNDLLQALPRFDGRPTRIVLEEIEAELGLELDLDLLRKLVDFGVLTSSGYRYV